MFSGHRYHNIHPPFGVFAGDTALPMPQTPSKSQVTVAAANEFSLLNSFWFVLSSFMQQGCYILPHSFAGRIVSGVWWFFCFVLISSYTANFAALLTIDRMTMPINSVEDLVAQTTVHYGTVSGGTTADFFKVICPVNAAEWLAHAPANSRNLRFRFTRRCGSTWRRIQS